MEESLKKLKFYDNWFKAFWLSLLLITVTSFILYVNLFLEIIIMVSALLFVVSLIIITWGMIYHEIKRKSWCWIGATVIMFFIGGLGGIISVFYYYCVMRKEFKNGKGIYE